MKKIEKLKKLKSHLSNILLFPTSQPKLLYTKKRGRNYIGFKNTAPHRLNQNGVMGKSECFYQQIIYHIQI